MRVLAVILTVAAAVARGEIRDVVKSAEVDRMFAGAGPALTVLAKTNYTIEFRSASGSSGKTGGWQSNAEADEFWFVRKGAAKIAIRSGGDGERQHDVSAGYVVSVPRTAAYQINPSGGGFQYVGVRVFPTERRMRIGIGAGPEPRPMADVASKEQIDATFTAAEKNVTLHSAGAALINHVIYKGRSGPWEVHQTCDDIYFARMGTARTQLDGRVTGGKEDPPGEIRGTGVSGAREFTMAPGDIVVIPRNTAHHSDPGSGKVGYLLLKVCD